MCSGGLYRFVQLALRMTQRFFRPGAVALHIVMVCRASPFHFMDRLDDMFVHLFQVMPVTNLSVRRAEAKH